MPINKWLGAHQKYLNSKSQPRRRCTLVLSSLGPKYQSKRLYPNSELMFLFSTGWKLLVTSKRQTKQNKALNVLLLCGDHWCTQWQGCCPSCGISSALPGCCSPSAHLGTRPNTYLLRVEESLSIYMACRGACKLSFLPCIPSPILWTITKSPGVFWAFRVWSEFPGLTYS